MKQLSVREIEIIKYSAEGLTAKQVARLTGLEHRTVEIYIRNVRKKLQAKNMAHAIFIACKENMLSVM